MYDMPHEWEQKMEPDTLVLLLSMCDFTNKTENSLQLLWYL